MGSNIERKARYEKLAAGYPDSVIQGKAKWNTSLEFIDLIKSVDDRLKCYTANFQYLLVDLVR